MSKKKIEIKFEDVLKWAHAEPKKRTVSTDWLWKAGFTAFMIFLVIAIIFYFSTRKPNKKSKLDKIKDPSYQLDPVEHDSITYIDEKGIVISADDVGKGKYKIEN